MVKSRILLHTCMHIGLAVMKVDELTCPASDAGMTAGYTRSSIQH